MLAVALIPRSSPGLITAPQWQFSDSSESAAFVHSESLRLPLTLVLLQRQSQ